MNGNHARDGAAYQRRRHGGGIDAFLWPQVDTPPEFGAKVRQDSTRPESKFLGEVWWKGWMDDIHG